MRQRRGRVGVRLMSFTNERCSLTWTTTCEAVTSSRAACVMVKVGEVNVRPWVSREGHVPRTWAPKFSLYRGVVWLNDELFLFVERRRLLFWHAQESSRHGILGMKGSTYCSHATGEGRSKRTVDTEFTKRIIISAWGSTADKIYKWALISNTHTIKMRGRKENEQMFSRNLNKSAQRCGIE